jgi:serine/threonine protein kinase
MYTGCFHESIARTYFKQLVSGLQVCHQKGVYHRDIKPENLLLDGDFMLKIADFGLSALHEDGDGGISMLHTECGTRGYMAPEILAHRAYDGAKADVWSAGVVLFIMLSGFPPFQIAASSDWWFRAVLKNQYEAFWNAHLRSAQFSPGAMRLLSRVFCADPNSRITIEQIKEDPWFDESSISMEALAGDLQRRQMQVESEKRKEKEAERRKREAEKDARAAEHGAQEFDPFQQNVFRAIGIPGAEEAAKAAAEAPRPPAISEAHVTQAVATYTTFYTNGEHPSDVYGRLGQALSMLLVNYKGNEQTYKIKASAQTPQGKVDLVVQIFEVDGQLHVVHVRRRNGNMLKFQDIFRKLEASLADIIVPGPSSNGDANQVAEAASNTAAQEDGSGEVEQLAEAVQLI